MQVDLEADGASVEGLPRFQQGLFHARRLRQAGISLTVLAVVGWVLALFVALFAPLSIWPVVLINCASALLVMVAGLQSAWWVADWRAQALEEPAAELTVEETGRYARLVGRFARQIGAPVLWLGGWSLGGMLASELARRRGDHCCGLLTLASNPSFVSRADCIFQKRIR